LNPFDGGRTLSLVTIPFFKTLSPLGLPYQLLGESYVTIYLCPEWSYVYKYPVSF